MDANMRAESGDMSIDSDAAILFRYGSAEPAPRLTLPASPLLAPAESSLDILARACIPPSPATPPMPELERMHDAPPLPPPSAAPTPPRRGRPGALRREDAEMCLIPTHDEKALAEEDATDVAGRHCHHCGFALAKRVNTQVLLSFWSPVGPPGRRVLALVAFCCTPCMLAGCETADRMLGAHHAGHTLQWVAKVAEKVYPGACMWPLCTTPAPPRDALARFHPPAQRSSRLSYADFFRSVVHRESGLAQRRQLVARVPAEVRLATLRRDGGPPPGAAAEARPLADAPTRGWCPLTGAYLPR